jgi:hypothetical protein
LIAFVFARPYLVATEPSTRGRLVAVLLDRSASMGLGRENRPIDQALAKARSIWEPIDPETQREAVTFDRKVQPPAAMA